MRKAYTIGWTKDYESLADVVLVASGQSFPAHAAVLNSTLLNGLAVSKMCEVQIDAAVFTMEAILELAYLEKKDLEGGRAHQDAGICEVLKTLDFLGCDRLIQRYLAEFIPFVISWANNWKSEYRCDDGEFVTSRALNPPYEALNLERMVELCVGVLTFPRKLDDMIKRLTHELRSVYKYSHAGWFTLMTQPGWDAVPGSVMALFVTWVTYCPDARSVVPANTCERVVTLSFTPNTQTLPEQPPVQRVAIDRCWILVCEPREEYYWDPTYPTFDLYIERKPDIQSTTNTYSRIEVEVVECPGDVADRVILCLGQGSGQDIEHCFDHHFLSAVGEETIRIKATIKDIFDLSK